MDHSYCLPNWSLPEDVCQVRISDLLTDHTYALPPECVWTEPFDSVHDWYADSSLPPDPSVDVQSAVTIDSCSLSGPYSILDSLFSRIELRIRPESELKLLQKCDLTSLPSVKSNGSVLHGSASDIFQLLLSIEDVYQSQLTDKTIVPTGWTESVLPKPSDISCPEEEGPPLYVTIVRKDKKQAHKNRSKPSTLLRDDRKLHTPFKLHRCPECSRTFTRHFALTEHIRMIHERNPRYRCGYCDHGFKRPALLRDHIYSRHTRTNRFICPICHKGFIRRPDCLRHQMCHTGSLEQ